MILQGCSTFRIRVTSSLTTDATIINRTHQQKIEAAFGVQANTINARLVEHSETKNELYTAIDITFGNVTETLRIFRTLLELYPKKIASYGQLRSPLRAWLRELSSMVP